MNKQEWKKLAKVDKKKYLELYKDFMYNAHNYMRCTECPANENEMSTYECLLPCGQYRCWILCYCY